MPNNYFRLVEFTLQAGCPVMCTFCPMELFLKNYRSQIRKFTVNSFKQALLNLQNSRIRDIAFCGFSEPLYHKNLPDFINLSVEAGFTVEITSTLKGLNVESIKKVKDLPIKWNVSLQPFGISNRKGLKDEEAWNNIESFLELDSKFQVNFGCLDLNLSQEQKTQLNEKGKQIGIKNILYGDFQTRAGNIVHNTINNQRKKLYCDHMAPVILPNGDMTLCCQDFGQRHIIGNILKTPFNDILSSDILRKILNIMQLKEKGSILCHTCEVAVPLPAFVSPFFCPAIGKIVDNNIINSILPIGSQRRKKFKPVKDFLKNLMKKFDV